MKIRRSRIPLIAALGEDDGRGLGDGGRRRQINVVIDRTLVDWVRETARTRGIGQGEIVAGALILLRSSLESE